MSLPLLHRELKAPAALCSVYIGCHVLSLFCELGIAGATVTSWRNTDSSQANSVSTYLFFAASLLSTLVGFFVSVAGIRAVLGFMSRNRATSALPVAPLLEPQMSLVASLVTGLLKSGSMVRSASVHPNDAAAPGAGQPTHCQRDACSTLDLAATLSS